MQDSEEEEEEAEGAKLVTKKGEEPKEGTRSGSSRHEIGCHLRLIVNETRSVGGYKK